MIQRIQTVWWLLSIVAMTVLVFVPLFEYGMGDNLTQIMGLQVNYIYGPLIGQSLLTLVAIFLFKKRSWQIGLGYFIILNQVAIGLGMLVYYKAWDAQPELRVLPWAGMLLLAILFQILAIRGVKKDEALVRSMDRLR